jgi:hypothetical protein
MQNKTLIEKKFITKIRTCREEQKLPATEETTDKYPRFRQSLGNLMHHFNSCLDHCDLSTVDDCLLLNTTNEYLVSIQSEDEHVQLTEKEAFIDKTFDELDRVIGSELIPKLYRLGILDISEREKDE